MRYLRVLAIIVPVLIVQTSASLFDELRGAVSSVETSFGKLLSDVVYDVKETIDCTLLAVEQVLSLGMFSDESDYDRRCKDAPAQAEQPVVESEPEAPAIQEIYTQTPDVYTQVPELSNKESRQVDSSILDVDEVLCDVLKKDDTHSQLETVKLALQNETERLTEISDLLRKQLQDLSKEVKEKFKSFELQTSEPSVETIWEDIQILHEIEQRHKNTPESRKISHILDQILDILDANEEERTTADEYKIKEIMQKLSKHAKDGSSDLWKTADEYPKDFREYANKIFEESSGNSPNKDSNETSERESVNNILEKDSKDEKPETITIKEEPQENSKKEEPKENTKKEEPKEDTTKEEPKEDTKNDEPKEDTKKDEPKEDSKKEEPKEYSKKEEPKEDSKKEEPKEDSQKEEPKEDSKKEEPKAVTTAKPKQKKRKHPTTTTTTVRPLSIEELSAQYGSLFDIMADVDSGDTKQTAESAYNIIEETKDNELVIQSIEDLDSNKEAVSTCLFGDPDLLDSAT